jgi:hypothetical protein
MAQMRENIDAISNMNKEGKMVISRITRRAPKPMGR